MKANLKGLGGIKGFFLLHGEKLAILAVGLCTLLFIYYSTRLERLDDRYQATNLQQQISLTKADIEKADWNTAVSEYPDEVRVRQELAKSADPTVDPKQYSFRGFDDLVIKATVLRSDPDILAAVDVRATGGSGLLPFIDKQIMKERQLAREAEEAQKAQEEAKKADKEQKLQEEGGGRNPRNRNRDRDEGMMGNEVDPEHPNRRPVEGVSRAPGAQVMGDERIERAFWAIVVAKVSIKEQLRLYRDAFENTRGGFNPQYDFPRYAGYFVQRAEVRPGQELQWVNVDVYDGQGHKMGQRGKPAPVSRAIMNELYQVIAKEWAAEMPELVDERYLDFERLLAFPLPPLLGRDWGSEVTHPDIPLAINAPPPEEEVDPTLAKPAETPADATDEDSFSRPSDPNLNTIRRPGVGMMPGQGFSSRGFRGEGEEGRFRGAGMMSRPSMFMEGEGGGRGFFRGGEGSAATGVLPKGVDAWLLRFFDFSVEPGKKYKYRVRLVLDDPNNYYVNAHIEPNTLDSKVHNRLRESAKGRPDKRPVPIRYAEWSAPSPTVGIPLSGGVRLAAAKVPTGKLFNDEPTATLLVEAFDVDEKGNAIHAAKEKELRRGYVANMVEETEYLTADAKWIDKDESFKFLTGITVVDVAGGEKLVKDMQAPSRVLLLDSAGELSIRNELDDAEAVNLHRIMFAKPDKRKGGRGGEGEMPRMFGPGGGRGRGRDG